MELVSIVAEFLLAEKKAELKPEENGFVFSYSSREGIEYDGWVKFFAAHLYEIGFVVARLDAPGQALVAAMCGFGRVFFLQPEEEGGTAQLVWIPGHQYLGSTLGLRQTLDVIFTDGETTVDDMLIQLSMTAELNYPLTAKELASLLDPPEGHA